MAFASAESVILICILPTTMAIVSGHIDNGKKRSASFSAPLGINKENIVSADDGNDTNLIQEFGISLPGVLEFPPGNDTYLQALDKSVIDAANNQQFQIFAPTFACICVLLTIGVLGNIIALTVYFKHLKKAIARQFIITLACSDLVTSVFAMPSELHLMMAFFSFDFPWLCKTIRFTAYMTNNASSFTLLAIAIERHRIICKPWHTKLSVKLSRRICYLNVFLAILGSLPMVFIYGTYTTVLREVPLNSTSSNAIQRDASFGGNNTNVLRIAEPNLDIHKVYGKSCMMDDNIVGSAFPFYMVSVYIGGIILMFLVLIFLYGQVIRSLALRRRQSMSLQDGNMQRSSAHRVRHVTFTVIVLTVLYEICYLPCLITVCIRLAHPEFYGTLSNSGKILFQFCLKSYLLCSALNPCVYCFCNKEFVDGLRALVMSVVLPLSRKNDLMKVNSKSERESKC